MLLKTGIHIIILIICLLFNILFISCEAPRSNPLDPDNQVNSGMVSLEGIVQTLSVPYTPLEGVSVLWLPENQTGAVTSTDAKGNFVFVNINRVSGNLVMQKSGFFSDTLNITWGSEEKITRFLNLNKIPQIDSIAVFTSVMPGSPPVFELDVNTKIADPDNDIDSVYIQNDYLKINTALNYDPMKGLYQITFNNTHFNSDDPEKLVGQVFSVVVEDKYHHTHTAGKASITRIINENVSLVFPVNNNMVDTLPQFTWDQFQAGYTFTYTLEIYSTDFTRELVQQVTGIPANFTTYTLTNALEKQNYDWVVWVVDKFGNRSMSLPGTFSVQ